MQRPLLYTFRRCPYAMRARMGLLQAGVEFDAHEIVLREKPPRMIELSPKGTVPVLVLPEGVVIDESLDIMRWAFDGRDDDGWWRRSASPTCLELIRLNDGPFKRCLDRYKYPERHPDSPDRDAARDEAVACLLQPLERALGAQPFLGGERPCAADLAIFPFVRQFRAVDEAWFEAQALPATRSWLQGWLESGLFQQAMKKLPVARPIPFSTA